MSKMKFKKDLLSDLIDGRPGGSIENVTLIECNSWRSDGKYDLRNSIVEFENKFYIINESRSGSYHTDYHYERDDWPQEVELSEVKKVEVTTHKWVTVK